MTTYFLGNSHLILTVVDAYGSRAAAERAHSDWEGERVSRSEVGLGGDRRGVCLSSSMAVATERLLELVGPDVTTIVAMVRGNEFAYESLIDTEPRWDFICEGRAADPSRLFVQIDDVNAHLDARTEDLLLRSSSSVNGSRRLRCTMRRRRRPLSPRPPTSAWIRSPCSPSWRRPTA